MSNNEKITVIQSDLNKLKKNKDASIEEHLALFQELMDELQLNDTPEHADQVMHGIGVASMIVTDRYYQPLGEKYIEMFENKTSEYESYPDTPEKTLTDLTIALVKSTYGLFKNKAPQ